MDRHAGHQSRSDERAYARNLHQPTSELSRPGKRQDLAVILEDLELYQSELRHQHLEAAACLHRNPLISLVVDDGEQSIDPSSPNRRNDAELRHMRARRVGDHDQLPGEHQPDLVKHHRALLARCLHSDEAHARTGDGLTDGLRVGHVVLLPLHVRLYVLGRHQLDLVAKLRQLACPEV
jgi:hypothetical protein